MGNLSVKQIFAYAGAFLLVVFGIVLLVLIILHITRDLVLIFCAGLLATGFTIISIWVGHKLSNESAKVVSKTATRQAEAYNKMPSRITIENDSNARSNAGLLQQKNLLQRTQDDDLLQQQLLQLQKENLLQQQDQDDEKYNVLGDEKTESVLEKFKRRRKKDG